MVTTYEDKTGKVFKTRQEAKASNLAVVAPISQIKTPVQPTVSANALATPSAPVTVPQPLQPSIPESNKRFVSSVARDTNGFITAKSEEAKQLKDLQATYGALNEQGTLSDMFKTQLEDTGVNTDLKELKDINLRLADAQTASNLTKTRIATAPGQGESQAQRAITQEDREAAVRNSGDAARAAVLQGNIETATQLAKDTVNLAFQDRQLEATNMLNQINMVQKQVDEQTSQLLEEDKRQYEAELANIKELKDNISTAMVSGANQSEIARLNDPNLDDASKLALAQSITARGANQLRNLEIAQKQASIAASNRSNQPSGNEYGTLSGKPQNATQASANGFADRIAQANTSLSLLGSKFTGDLAFGASLPNALQTGDRQAYEQAKNNFATAVLRRESGASIAPSEFETLEKTYFPSRGDKPEVIAQKEALRNTVINSFYREANVARPVIAGDVIEDDNGVLYRVGIDGETLEPVE